MCAGETVKLFPVTENALRMDNCGITDGSMFGSVCWRVQWRWLAGRLFRGLWWPWRWGPGCGWCYSFCRGRVRPGGSSPGCLPPRAECHSPAGHRQRSVSCPADSSIKLCGRGVLSLVGMSRFNLVIGNRARSRSFRLNLNWVFHHN